jgi:glycosyltransferase involved in cell wall biosynthesis
MPGMPPEHPNKLTVLQVLPALEVGGVERGTLEVAQALVRRGHRSLVASAGGRLVNRLIAEGSEHIMLPLGTKSPLTLRHIPRLKQILAEENVTILHARSRMPAWICYLAWRSMPAQHRPHFVTTVHGPYTVNFYSSIMVRGERVVAISEYIRNYILDNYPDIDNTKIELIHRGVSQEQFPYGYRPPDVWLARWQEQHLQLADKFVVTLPARITRWKGQEDFIEIIGAAKKCGVPIHGLVVGAPHPRKKLFYKQLAASVRKRDLVDDITFLGHRDDLKEIMAISDVVMSLAREPEAFGRTALEALCLGTPVIAYDHGGAAEILSAIFPAGLVKPFDQPAAVAKLQEFFNNAPAVPCYNPFTLDAMLQKILSLYESLALINSVP